MRIAVFAIPISGIVIGILIFCGSLLKNSGGYVLEMRIICVDGFDDLYEIINKVTLRQLQSLTN